MDKDDQVQEIDKLQIHGNNDKTDDKISFNVIVLL